MTGQPSRAIVTYFLVPRAVDEPLGGEPGHQAAQLRPHLLDRMLRGLLPELAEVRQAAAVLGDPLVGELARLDVGEDRLHRLARLVADDALAAHRLGVGEPEALGIAARVLREGEEAGDAAALLVLAAHEVARALGRHHEDVHAGGRDDLPVVDVEAVAEGQVLAGREPRRDLVLVDLGALLVGHEHHDDVGLARGGGGVDHAQPGLLGLRARGAVGAQPDAHVHPAVAQVLCVRVALAAVADDGDLLAPERPQVGVLVVVDAHAGRSFSFPSTVRTRVPRYIATLPVRTISRMPSGFKSSTSAFTFSSAPVISTT